MYLRTKAAPPVTGAILFAAGDSTAPRGVASTGPGATPLPIGIAAGGAEVGTTRLTAGSEEGPGAATVAADSERGEVRPERPGMFLLVAVSVAMPVQLPPVARFTWPPSVLETWAVPGANVSPYCADT